MTTSPKPLWQRLEVGFLVLIVVLAFAVRYFHIHELMIFTYDQGRDMYAIQKIVRGDITLIGPTTGLPGVFLGPYMYYLMVPGYLLFNGSPFGVVIWQMALIVLTFPFLYYLLKPLVGRVWSAVAVLWLTLNPGAIDQARSIWNPSLVVMTTLPALYCLFASRKRLWLLPISFFFFGLSLQTELAYTFFLGPLFALWLLMHWQAPEKLLRLLPSQLRPSRPTYDWRYIGLAIFAFGLTLVPQGLFELKNNFLITNAVITEMGDTSKQVSYQKVWADRPTIIWNEIKDILGASAPGSTAVASVSFLSALYVLWAYRKKPDALFMSGYMLLPLFAFMFHRGNYGNFFDYYVTAHYLPAIAVIIIAVADIGKKAQVLRSVLLITVLLSLLYFFGYFARIIYNIPLFQYTAAKQIEALHYARSATTTDSPALEVFVPNLLPVAYQYLSEWMSRTGQAEAIDFGADGHTEFVLIHEPAMGYASQMAFDEWYAGWKLNATCKDPVQFGITTVEVCQR